MAREQGIGDESADQKKRCGQAQVFVRDHLPPKAVAPRKEPGGVAEEHLEIASEGAKEGREWAACLLLPPRLAPSPNVPGRNLGVPEWARRRRLGPPQSTPGDSRVRTEAPVPRLLNSRKSNPRAQDRSVPSRLLNLMQKRCRDCILRVSLRQTVWQ